MSRIFVLNNVRVYKGLGSAPLLNGFPSLTRYFSTDLISPSLHLFLEAPAAQSDGH